MSLFGFLREKWEACRRLRTGRAERVPSRPKQRRCRPTVKLELEGLTERILPSVSAVAPLAAPSPVAAVIYLPTSPSVAAVTPQSAATAAATSTLTPPAKDAAPKSSLLPYTATTQSDSSGVPWYNGDFNASDPNANGYQ